MRVELPIDDVLPQIVRSLAVSPSLVLEAPPGAGKTTRVPPALLGAPWLGDQVVVVLEPRRLAARMAAARVAEELGEKLGATVGYSVRFESIGGPATRIRFVTEGVLTRRLAQDPELRGVGAVLLDEFHERHLHADVALALLRRLQRTSRPELRLVVMSATLDTEPVKDFLGCESVVSMGRQFDVAVEHLAAPDDRPLASQIASGVRRALMEEAEGHVLVFLPGMREIQAARERCERLTAEKEAVLCVLHGDMPPQEQDRAVRPSRKRKVILSTNVAESSVTIDGVACVVDSGLVRSARYAPWSGLPTLAVVKASRASLAQRAGRAGRTRPGRCYRLFTKVDEAARPLHDIPEIRRADLAQTLLELRASGVRDLEWFEAPEPAGLAAAEALLVRLGALDSGGALTPLGRRMLRHPLHPRLARIVEEADARGVGDDGCLAAAILSERDLAARGGSEVEARATEASDVVQRMDRFREVEASGFSSSSVRAVGLDMGAVQRVRRAYAQLVRAAGSGGGAPPPASAAQADAAVRRAILAGYADRVARRVRPGASALALAGGGSAELAKESVVRTAEFMACVEAEERRGGGVLVRIASAIEPEWLLDLDASRVTEDRVVEWDADGARVVATERMLWDGIVLDATRMTRPTGPEVRALLAKKVLELGLEAVDPELPALLDRARFAATVDGRIALGEDAVRSALEAACEGLSSLAEVRAAGLSSLIRASLGPLAPRLDALAPARLTLPRGRTVKVHYEPGKSPWIESRLQDFFGMTKTPTVGDGRVPLVVHLLAPNQRAVQVTQDLEGFWCRHYPTIRKELMRKYPRHAWPEDPTTFA
jgi:ATP-dependent helicase HrpB